MPVAPRIPDGVALEDGYQTIITFEGNDAVALWEKTVQPPGLEGGEKIDITTMHNKNMRTYAPRWLKEATDGQMTVAYDPAVLPELLCMINSPKKIIIQHSDCSKWKFDGYLRSFVPNAVSEGAQPEATCTIVFTNVDKDNPGEEIKPIFEDGSCSLSDSCNFSGSAA
jgi:hypothetical protein